jgi:hypothetical protein
VKKKTVLLKGGSITLRVNDHPIIVFFKRILFGQHQQSYCRSFRNKKKAVEQCSQCMECSSGRRQAAKMLKKIAIL